jgi:hypothetical protein
MYLIIIFVSPLYFLIRGKIGGLIVNAILYCLAVACLVTIVFAWAGVIFWALAVGHAAWHIRRESMMEHAELIATKMAEVQVKGQAVQRGGFYADSSDIKKCPMCAETIKYEAKMCKHCGHKFSEEEGDIPAIGVWTSPSPSRPDESNMNASTAQTCPSCQEPLSAAARFCHNCGGAVRKPSMPTCSQCGETVTLGAQFCGGCGSKLK